MGIPRNREIRFRFLQEYSEIAETGYALENDIRYIVHPLFLCFLSLSWVHHNLAATNFPTSFSVITYAFRQLSLPCTALYSVEYRPQAYGFW